MTLPNLIFGPTTVRGPFPAPNTVHVDLDRLYESRLLIQGVSGSGKSTMIRSLLEQTHGKVPQLVVDFDGDFVTLREKFDYVLVGPGGDVPIAIKTAKITMRRLAELDVSAIFDISEMKFDQRREWVRLACEELVLLPRKHWSTRLFVLDEAHVFCPERGSGDAESTAAVIDVITLGRKRGIVSVCATQRLSKFHKDAAAELLNKVIGYTDDVDLARAGDQLGMLKEQRDELRHLEPHTFYVKGPAISRPPLLVETLMPATKPPPRGQARPEAPPAPAGVKKVLSQLADLPKEAEEEARTVADLQRKNAEQASRIRQLEKGIATKEIVKTVVDQAEIDKAVNGYAARQRRELQPILVRLQRGAGGIGALITTIGDLAKVVLATPPAPSPTERKAISTVLAAKRAPSPDFDSDGVSRTYTEANSYVSLGKGEQTMLTAIAQYPDGALRDQLTVLTGYKRSSRDTYIQRLTSAGFAEIQGNTVRATDAGVDALGSDFEPLPQGEQLQEYWLNRLPEGERKIFEILISDYPRFVPRDELSEVTGYRRSSRDTYLQRLKSRRLIDATAAGVRANTMLFEGALV